MNEKHSRNTAASVRQRLLNLARERGMDFGLMLYKLRHREVPLPSQYLPA